MRTALAVCLVIVSTACTRERVGRVRVEWSLPGSQSCDRAGIIWVRVGVSGMDTKGWPCKDDNNQMGATLEKIPAGVHQFDVTALDPGEHPLYRGSQSEVEVTEGGLATIHLSLERTGAPSMFPDLMAHDKDIPQQ